jgi:hypothetical protein
MVTIKDIKKRQDKSSPKSGEQLALIGLGKNGLETFLAFKAAQDQLRRF